MASTGDPWRLGRRPALDGLRGVAVLLVVAYHAIARFEFAAGTVGVTMFFTLSGFLITAMLLEERADSGRINLPAFMLRRARRLLPALGAFLATMVVLILLGVPVGNLSQFPALLLYVGNWLPAFGDPLGSLSHLWSLAVEEQFYLAWPLVVLVCRTPRAVAAASAVGMVVSAGLRFALWDGGAGAYRIYCGTDTRMDGLLVGCLLAALLHCGWRPRVGAGLPLAGLAVLALTTDRYLFGPTVAPWLTAAVIAGVVTSSPRWLLWSPLVTIGRRSYGLYLWHLPLLWTFTPVLPGPRPLALAAMCAAAWGMTCLSWRYVEQPFLRPSSTCRPRGVSRPAASVAAGRSG